jgi:hypothetical protein
MTASLYAIVQYSPSQRKTFRRLAVSVFTVQHVGADGEEVEAPRVGAAGVQLLESFLENSSGAYGDTES